MDTNTIEVRGPWVLAVVVGVFLVSGYWLLRTGTYDQAVVPMVAAGMAAGAFASLFPRNRVIRIGANLVTVFFALSLAAVIGATDSAGVSLTGLGISARWLTSIVIEALRRRQTA